MDKDFVAFEMAKVLREKGFPQKRFGKYDMMGPTYTEDGQLYANGCITEPDDAYSVPTIPEVLKCLREKHIDVIIMCGYTEGDKKFYYPQIWWHGIDKSPVFKQYDTYNEAATAGIEYAINNLI